MATTSRRTGTTTLRTLTIFPSQGCRGRRKRYPKQALAVKFRKGRELRLFGPRSAAESPQRQRRVIGGHRGAVLVVELLQLLLPLLVARHDLLHIRARLA